MNLLAYAEGQYLDHLGALLGVFRQDASAASCIVKFTLSAPLRHSIDIPIGTRITPDGKIYFATTELMRILAGQTESMCICLCTEAGSSGNGFVPGQISRIVDPFAYSLEAVNITMSEGGEDTESDEAFRERIHIAPESFTNAGSIKGYEYFALSADPNISDIAVEGPPDTQPGNINIYVLMNGGAMPSDDILAKVLKACSADDVRPDTDYVHALRPQAVDFEVNVLFWIDAEDSSGATVIQEAVNLAVMNYISWQEAKLGRDINPSKLHHDIIAAGAKRCEIISPGFCILKKSQCARNNSPVKINFSGLE